MSFRSRNAREGTPAGVYESQQNKTWTSGNDVIDQSRPSELSRTRGLASVGFMRPAAERFKVLDEPFTLRSVLDPLLDSPLTGRRVLGILGLVALLVWLPLVAMGGIVTALRGVADAVAGDPQHSLATPQSVIAALIIIGLCILTAGATLRFRPELTLLTTFLVGLIVVLVGAIGTHSLPALFCTIALVFGAWLAGASIVSRIGVDGARDHPIVQAPISVALGLGFIGLYLFLLVGLNRFSSNAIVGSFFAIVVILAILDRSRLKCQIQALAAWKPAVPTYFEAIAMAIIVGLASYAILAAFAPENMYDPFRQHVPIAREIWQSGSLPFIQTMGVTKDPIQGHLLFALGWGFGGIVGAKLVNTAIGLVGIAGIAGLSWLCGGRPAAVASTAIFSASTIVLWELGHAYTDMLAVTYTITAVTCVALWQLESRQSWLVLSGVLAGFGLASKLTVGWLIVAIAVGLLIVGNRPWSFLNRITAIITFACGTLVAIPWLARSYLFPGSMPAKLAILVNFITESLPGVPAIIPPPVDSGFVQLDLNGLAIGQSPFDLLRVPWILTFSSGQHPNSSIGPGEIGILLLLTLPLAFLAPRNRTIAFLSATVIVSYIVWWFTPLQITRHLLPTLGILSAISGIGFAQSIISTSRFKNTIGSTAKFAILMGVIAAPLFFLPGTYSHVGGSSQAPVDLIFHRETEEQFIRQEVPAGAALLSSNQLVPADTPLGYIGKWGGAQLYTEARLVNIGQFTQILIDKQFGESDKDILKTLESLGLTYFIWDRATTKPEDWRSRLLSTEFLGENTRIVEGDRSAYLLEVAPGDGWSKSPEKNLLSDAGFEKIRRDNSQWKINGHALRDNGSVTLQDESSIGQDVPVRGDQPYFLTVTGSCARSTDALELRLFWKDADGNIVETTNEEVIPGKEPTTQFLWHRAPHDATTVTAEIGGIKDNECSITTASLFQSV